MRGGARCLELDLTRLVAPLGLHFAPDLDSIVLDRVNSATTSWPHCLKYGVTSTHVLASRSCCPTGKHDARGLDPEPWARPSRARRGEDAGLATKIAVAVDADTAVFVPCASTCLEDDAAATVIAIIATFSCLRRSR